MTLLAAFAVIASLHVWASSTCYSQGTTTASGERVHVGIVAQNTLRFGTLIRLDHPAFGRRYFRVEDPSERACLQYGRREVGYTVR